MTNEQGHAAGEPWGPLIVDALRLGQGGWRMRRSRCTGCAAGAERMRWRTRPLDAMWPTKESVGVELRGGAASARRRRWCR